MTQSTTLPNWAKALAGSALLATALAAGGLSFYMNISAGLGIGLAVAVAFGLSDVAKMLVPVTCAAIGWTGHLRSIYIIASVVSIICAGLFLADQFGSSIAAKEDRAAVIGIADRQIENLQTALANTRKMADAEAARGGCGDKCRALQERADRLQADLNVAIAKRANAPATEAVDGKAEIIARAIGADVSDTSRNIALILVIAALLIGELCAHLAGPAAQLIGAAMRGQIAMPEPVAKPANSCGSRPAKAIANRQYFLNRLRKEHPAYAAKVDGGELSVYAASIAAGLRKASRHSKWTTVDAYMKPEAVTA